MFYIPVIIGVTSFANIVPSQCCIEALGLNACDAYLYPHTHTPTHTPSYPHTLTHRCPKVNAPRLHYPSGGVVVSRYLQREWGCVRGYWGRVH